VTTKTKRRGGKAKPKKPRRDYPLFWHQTGQWCKKFAGKFYYFGTDPVEAEKRYDAEKDDIRAGRTVERSATPEGGPALRDLANDFLAAKRSFVDSGELTAYTFADCYRTCEALLGFFGKHKPVGDLRPADFGRYRAELAKTRGLVTLANLIIRTRSFFNWCLKNKLILAPVDYGTLFEIPGKKAKRAARNQAKREGKNRTFSAEELRRIIDAARQPLKAMILLGVNCGYGQSDVGNLPLAALDLEGGWANFPRVKTEADRRAALWPETVAALKEAIAKRPKANAPEDEHLVFLTVKGNRWIQRGQVEGKEGLPYFNDNVAKEFNKLLVSLGLKRRGCFYNLRHCFRTAASNAQDREAVDRVMGHTEQSMGDYYVDHIEDERLLAVADTVRNWLWPTPEKADATKPTLKLRHAAG
jgi:integrase